MAVGVDDPPDTIALPGRPDHISFGSDPDELYLLTPSDGGFGLRRVRFEPPDSDRRSQPAAHVDSGVPYFSDVGSDGRLVTHAAEETRLIEPGGSVTVLDGSGAAYQTPSWHPDGASVVYARRGDGEHEIVRHHLDTDEVEVIGRYSSFAFFTIGPRGTFLAVSVLGGRPEGGPATQQAGYSEASPQVRTPDRTLHGGTWLIELESGRSTELGRQPISSPQWNPGGTSVLGRTSVQGIATWQVYGVDGSRSASTEHRVRRGGVSSYYLQFWDQLGRTQTVWAPDGAAFVFAAASRGGGSGIWVHTDPSQPPSFLTEGEMAFWAPDPL
ncbi:MAG: hypothetical protein P8N02_06340 [Actinomycetota bacterium]|nr:hypothetical protein [Actinomycetota bacterium]